MSAPSSAASAAASSGASAAAASAAAAPSAKSKPKKRKHDSGSPSLRSAIRIALVCQSNLNRSMEAHWLLQETGNIRSYSFGAGTKVRLPGESIDRPHVYEFGTTYDSMYKDLERQNRVRYSKNGMLQMLDRDRQLKDAPERWQDHYERYDKLATDKARAAATAATSGKKARSDGDASAADPLDDDVPPPPRHFDLIITYEKRVYDIVQADIEQRGHSAQSQNLAAHLLNIDTTDNHAEAAVSAQLTLELVTAIYDAHRKATGKAGDDDDDDDDDDEADGDGSSWEDSIDDIIDAFEKKNQREVAHTVLFY